MTEANEQEQKRPLTLRSGGTLGLRRPVETGQVRQSFSHGRSTELTSVAFALFVVALCFVPNWMLWRRQIFVKV